MVEEIAPGLYRFRLFRTLAECDDVLRMIDVERAKHSGAPNTMNRYGVTLGGKMRPFLADLVRDHVQPLAPDGMTLCKHPAAFAVDYTPQTQAGLALHTDASSMTLNVCLGHRFRGGRLACYPSGESRAAILIKQEPGYALVHAGSLPHRALRITSGSRTNLVLWCRARGAQQFA